AIANSKKADLFISLHLNASPDPKAKGIETYYLNFTTDPEAMRVAALENAMSDKGLSDLYDLVRAVLANTKLSESKLLAEKVQRELVRNLSRNYPYVEDRGVKYAPFLVLVGTRMPAILVEAGFISNPSEAELFKKEEFLEKIAEGIIKGIEAYVQSLKFSLNPSQNGKGS
ncbi:MAG: N-acetylmuramoyl-L-alanine amidase, partial [Thermodesulfobacteriaceae bacterium]|nr:N-acetylmuramoyl-L-alanine amidase [Thermodesulfobacteriaceae bacterium]